MEREGERGAYTHRPNNIHARTEKQRKNKKTYTHWDMVAKIVPNASIRM